MQLLETPEARARRYQNHAAKLRRQVDAAEYGQERADLLDIAAQYERIADRLVRAADVPGSRDGE